MNTPNIGVEDRRNKSLTDLAQELEYLLSFADKYDWDDEPARERSIRGKARSRMAHDMMIKAIEMLEGN